MKTYNGIELLQAIKYGEIEEGARFKITEGGLKDFVAHVENKNLKVNMFGKESLLGTNGLIESEFEELENQNVNIQAIEEIDKDDYYYDEVTEVIIKQQNQILKWAKQLDRQINNK